MAMVQGARGEDEKVAVGSAHMALVPWSKRTVRTSGEANKRQNIDSRSTSVTQRRSGHTRHDLCILRYGLAPLRYSRYSKGGNVETNSNVHIDDRELRRTELRSCYTVLAHTHTRHVPAWRLRRLALGLGPVRLVSVLVTPDSSAICVFSYFNYCGCGPALITPSCGASSGPPHNYTPFYF